MKNTVDFQFQLQHVKSFKSSLPVLQQQQKLN